MAEYQGNRYLEQKKEEESAASKYLKIGVAAAIGGAIGIRYYRDLHPAMATVRRATVAPLVGRTISAIKKMESGYGTLRTFLKGIDHALGDRGLIHHLANPHQFERKFERRIAQHIREVERRNQTPLGGDPTELETHFHNVLSQFKNLKQVTFESIRWEKLKEELYRIMPERMENGLHVILNQQKPEFFNNPTEGKIRGLIKRYSPEEAKKKGHQQFLTFEDEIEKERFVHTLLQTLKDYQSFDSLGISRKQFREIYKKNKQHLLEGFKIDHREKGSFLASYVGLDDWRPAKLKDVIGLLDKDAVQRPLKKGGHRDLNTADKLRRLMKIDPEFGELVVDSRLFVNDQGQLLDLRKTYGYWYEFLHGFRENFQIPFLRFNPVDLLLYSTWKGMKDAPKEYVLRRGTIHPFISGAKTVAHPFAHNQDALVGPLDQNYLYTAGRIIDIATGEIIEEGKVLASARFGTIPRMIAGMANLHRRDLRGRGVLARLFDVFGQENESIFQRFASIFTKFYDDNWERNAFNLLLKEDLDAETAEKVYKNLYHKIQERATPLSDDVVDYLNKWVKEAYGDIGIDLNKLNTPEEIMDALGRIRRAIGEPGSDVVPMSKKISDEIEGLNRQIMKTWDQYFKNPVHFLNNRRVLTQDIIPYLDDTTLNAQESMLVEKSEDVKRLIHQHALKQLDYHLKMSGSEKTVSDLIEEGIKKGILDEDAAKQIRNLDVLTTMRQWWHDVYMDPRYKLEALNEFASRVRDGEDPFSSALRETIEDMTPLWGPGPGLPPPNYQGFTGYTVINDIRGYRWALENYNKLVTQGVNPLKAGVSSAMDVLMQPFAGRGNLDKVTLLTMPFYVFAERLDNALAQVGLGLSQLHRGSMQSILFNQFFRRIVLPYMAYEQLKYFDDMTGDFFSDRLADTYVNMHLDVARFKEAIGLNRIGRQLAKLFPGFDQIAEWTPVKIFNFLTFGFFSDWRSEEELRKYYESGEDPVRKGRYWGMGSSNPWIGGRIDHYEPNWYRKLKSDYEYTETMYGSEDEYWANHWMPTLTHPFAPIKHFITDPYHWEEKHKEDRPYPVTGGFPELQQIPIIGPILDNTIGRILKPRRVRPDLAKAHREYLKAMNEYLTSKYLDNKKDMVAKGMPAGGVQLEKDPYPYLPEIELNTDGVYVETKDSEEKQSEEKQSGEKQQGKGVKVVKGEPRKGSGKGIRRERGKETARSQLILINQGYTDLYSDKVSVDSLEALYDPDFLADIDNIGRIDSVSGISRDVFYSLTELGGIYGFGTKYLLGWDESGRGLVWEPSSRMTSYTRMFWDLELGGLGKEVSEIFRRYVPRDPNKEYYNPIRNTMPEWLPGFDYWVNFQYGDSYTKIPHGEIRLPGEAYERLYKLHPDFLGKYGVFDRFRILADVAPYSEEFKKYKKLASLMKEHGMFTEEMEQEYREILEQVRERKKKYHFYPRRFSHADLKYETVTVTKVIDANTFLTEEYPNNPIKLAGIHIRSDDKEAQEFIRQFIYEGAKLRIGIDADPLFRVRNDSMNSIRAVVYAGDDGESPLNSIQGQNLNYIVANRQFGNVFGFGGRNRVSIRDDGSATSTVALFGDNTLYLGKAWEYITHDILPNLPVLGPFFDKFLQVRSPLEMYKQTEVYGKSWRPWTDVIGSWIMPMFESMAEKNPILAAATGAGIGWLATKGRRSGRYGLYVGAIIGGALSTLRVFRDHIRALRFGGSEYDNTWIPERRRKEREINEYFDRLKYIKYRALFEILNEKAIEEEGIDVRRYIKENERRGKENKKRKEHLQRKKKWLNIDKKIGYGFKEQKESVSDYLKTAKDKLSDFKDQIEEKISDYREELKELDEDRPSIKLGPYALMALRYYDEYTSTLYGADPNGDLRKIIKALPAKDREFFPEFLKASPEEREEILRLVPKDQRRFYEAKWGLDIEPKESMESYFSKHYLPGPDWEGWRPDVSLDDIKIKVIKNEGLELTEFGYWEDDEKRAELSDAKPIDIHEKSISSRVDISRIEEALKDAGLEDVKVVMNTTYGKEESKIDLVFNLIKDRTQEILHAINMNMEKLFSDD